MKNTDNPASHIEPYREWRAENRDRMDDLAAAVDIANGHSLNVLLTKKAMSASLRARCIGAGIPEHVLPPATKSKAQLEAELRQTRDQLAECWDMLAALRAEIRGA